MRPIVIVPRPGHAIEAELHGTITCLRNAGINAYNAVRGQVCALIWVDDENVSMSLETLRIAGFQATVLTETDMPH
jgi:hypothetical protein